MTITLPPELAAAVREQAERRGLTPEVAVLDALWRHFPVKLEPRDEWERGLLSLAQDCGVSLSDEALGREEMYE